MLKDVVVVELKKIIIKTLRWCFLTQVILLPFCPVHCLSAEMEDGSTTEWTPILQSGLHTIKDDYLEMYSRKRLLHMLIAFSAGALVANTHADQEVQDWYQDAIRSSGTDDIASVAKQFGNYRYAVPLAAVSALAGNFLGESSGGKNLGTWGSRTLRAYLLGFPLQIIAQPLIGGSRPDENRGSDWHPLQDSNGVSGHAFVGAVPFLTLAHMNDDNPYLKYLFYAASTLTALSRINNNDHYLSQAALGWYIAWEAADAVSYREKEKQKVSIGPALIGDTLGIQASFTW